MMKIRCCVCVFCCRKGEFVRFAFDDENAV